MSTAAEFLEKHGVRDVDAFAAYHYSYALYLCYLIDAMRMAEDITDGLCFDEEEACALFTCLKEAKEVMKECRKNKEISYPEFDPAELITLKGCRIEEGKILGSAEDAEQIARKWINDYHEYGKMPYCFEIAVYILFLLHEEVDYSFLVHSRRE